MTLKLSEAIRKGHTMIGEVKDGFLACGEGCAIGAAWMGLGHTEKDRFSKRGINHVYETISKECGVSHALLDEVSLRHYRGEGRLSLADWLDTLEPQKVRESDSDYTRRVLSEIIAAPVAEGVKV